MVPEFITEVDAVAYVGSEMTVRSSKSARHAWPLWSIRMFALKKGVSESKTME